MQAEQSNIAQNPKVSASGPERSQFENLSNTLYSPSGSSVVELHRTPPQINYPTPTSSKTPSTEASSCSKKTPATDSSEDSQYAKFRRNKTFKKNVLKRLKQIGPDPDNFEDLNKHLLDKINPKDVSGKSHQLICF